jgi:folate-binding protein YgfZ
VRGPHVIASRAAERGPLPGSRGGFGVRGCQTAVMTSEATTGAGGGPAGSAGAVVDLRSELRATVLDRDVVRVRGPEALAYLQGQLSQDVEGLAPGDVAWSFVLQPTGKVDAWVRVVRTADDEVVLDVDGGYGDAVATRLRRFLLRTKADIDRLDWRVVAVRGPGAEDAARAAAGGEGTTADLVVPAGWPGVDGYDVVGAGASLPEGVGVVDEPSYASARIRAGVPAMGAELTPDTIPAEVGQWVIDAAVDFTKGCFTGQELVARIESRGGNVPRRLRGLVLAGADRPPPAGAPVTVGGAEMGTVTSSAPALGGAGAVALAVVRRAVEPPADADVDGTAATVVDLPISG